MADAAETTTWCIALTSVDTGYELSGALADNKRTLKLKVTRKDEWAGLPVLTLLAGFVVAVLVGLIPTSLRRLVANAVLGRRLRNNRTRTGRERIKGLERLAQDLKGEGRLDEAMIGTLAQVATEGPEKAAAQRTKLRDAVKSSKLPAESPLLKAAIAEGRRTADAVGDFLKPDGTLLEEHPAATYRGALALLEAHQAELARQDEKIEERILKRCRDPRNALALARTRLVEIASPGDVERMDPAMEALQAAIETALADPKCAQGAAPAGLRPPDEAEDTEKKRGGVGLTEKLEISEGSVGKEVAAWLATIVALLAVVTFAYLTIKQATYDTKPTFGTFDDYFALFSAALGSTAAAGVLALLAYWRPGSEPEAA